MIARIRCQCGQVCRRANTAIPFRCHCGRVDEYDILPTLARTPVNPDYLEDRVRTCAACECRNGTRCGVLVDRGKPGLLMHAKGLPNQQARCPLGKWWPAGDPRNIRSTDARDDVTIATVHYNPCGYRRLRETYYEWLPTLPQKPVCYELVFDDDQPEIEGSIVIRGTRQQNAMWQKEPLLNIALAACETEYFCWIDHDIISESATWLSDSIELIGPCHHAVQLFETLKRLGKAGNIENTYPSWLANRKGPPGGAWITETDYLRHVGGFPTHQIVGGGDANFTKQIENSATFLPAKSYHLWHGQRRNRQHNSRGSILTRHQYDHRHDTKINDAGILEWASRKPNLHREVREFFERRREDG